MMNLFLFQSKEIGINLRNKENNEAIIRLFLFWKEIIQINLSSKSVKFLWLKSYREPETYYNAPYGSSMASGIALAA